MNAREENRRDFDLSDEPSSADTESEPETCIYCGALMPADLHDWYCSAICAAMAHRDNCEDR